MLPIMKSEQVNMCRLHFLFIEEVKEGRIMFAMSGTDGPPFDDVNLLGENINSTNGRCCDGRLLGFLVPTLRRNRPILRGVKTQKTTEIWTATAKTGKKYVLDARKEDGLEVNTKKC
jgi:hypothetical protein